MKTSEQSWKKQLNRELGEVAFSQEKKNEIADNLRQTLGQKDASLPKRFLHKLDGFWNGSFEVSLAPALLVLAFVLVGAGGSIADLLYVDQTAAMLLLKLGSESIDSIRQGVSIL